MPKNLREFGDFGSYHLRPTGSISVADSMYSRWR